MRSLLGGDQFSSGGGQTPPTSIDHVTKAPVACPVRACVMRLAGCMCVRLSYTPMHFKLFELIDG